MIEQIEHGHHVFRAYWKNALLRQYEKFSRFLRLELCSNNLRDFNLRKAETDGETSAICTMSIIAIRASADNTEYGGYRSSSYRVAIEDFCGH